MTEQQTATSYTLWHRVNRKHQWRAVASAATEAELTQHYGRHGQHNEYLTLPSGQHPDAKRKRMQMR